MQKDLNSKCTEKRSQVKSDPIFPHDPNVNKNIIFTLPHSEYKFTLDARVIWEISQKSIVEWSFNIVKCSETSSKRVPMLIKPLVRQ